jgi:ABC-type transport system substrate-binding protein
VQPLLTLTAIRKSFAGVRALKGVSFDLRPGEIHALVGENGAGKSTLIKVVTGAHQPDAGTLEVRGQPVTDNDPVRVQVAEEVRRQLEPLGIRATVASTTFSVLRRDFLQERRYDAAIAGWDQGADPDPYFGWHSSQMGSAGLNIANFEDTVSDELIAKARTTNDAEVRKDLYHQIQDVWQQQVPSVIIAYPRYLYVHTDSLKGFEPGVLFAGSQRFYDVQKWHG